MRRMRSRCSLLSKAPPVRPWPPGSRREEPRRRCGAGARHCNIPLPHAIVPMHRRLKRAVATAALRPGRALRDALAAGYGRADFLADLAAGAIVGIVALPLSMALAIASGVAPQHGLQTAIVAGFVAALLGGSRVQVTGPTAAFRSEEHTSELQSLR